MKTAGQDLHTPTGGLLAPNGLSLATEEAKEIKGHGGVSVMVTVTQGWQGLALQKVVSRGNFKTKTKCLKNFFYLLI